MRYDWQMGDLADQAIYPDERYMQPPPLQSEAEMAQQAREAAALRGRQGYEAAAARPQENNRLNAVAGAIGSIPYAMGDLAAMPGQTMTKNPYQPGSEEWQFYEDQRRSNTYRAAPEIAMSTVGAGSTFAQPGALGMAGGRIKSEPLTGFAPGSAFEAKSPTIVRARDMPTAEDIAAIKAAAVQYGRKGWPTAERGVFATTPEAYAETTKLVPQVSIKRHLPGQPWETEPGTLPKGNRAGLIVENTEEIAKNIAERLGPWVERGDPRMKFYHTGPVLRGLEQYGGRTIPEANTFLRDWAGQGAATSPRTQTPPNLRNSSYLLYERARGNPLTPERYATEGNIPGFPMMGMHVNLAEDFATRGERPWVNPKPTTFRENWSGNLMDVTGDTHNIRSTLYEMDKVQPGSLPRGWFTNEKAYAKYRKEGFSSLDPGDIADTLESKAVHGIERQTEYLPMTEPWYRAAQKLGIAPAEAQSGGWFSYGDITGLQSPPKTIVNLLNDQVAATARTLGVPPEKIVEWWSQGKIPLAGFAGAGALAPAVMGDLARRDKYQ